MAASALSDLVLPEDFHDDVLNGATDTSVFFDSGVVADVTAEMDILPTKGTAIMPFWNDLSGSSQLAHNGVNLTVNAVTQGQDKAAVLSRAQVFGSQDLAAAFKGSDPVSFIQARFSAYWGREFDRIALQNLLAAMATTVSGASMVANVFDISALSGSASIITSESMIDAAGVLGDFAERFTAVAMHSAVERKLQKLDLIDDTPDSEGVPIKSYRGRAVIVTDRLAPTSGVYPTLFLGEGALAYCRGAPKRPAEIHREPLLNGGEEYVVNRHIFTMHPRGIAYTGSIAGNTATDAELATAAKWSRAWSAKNIAIGVFKHKIA